MAVSAQQIKIVQEPCEGGGGHSGLPIPNSCHSLCGRKATLNTGHSFFIYFFLPSVVERAHRADRTLVREDHTAGSKSADTVYCFFFFFFTPIWVHLCANAPVGTMYNIDSFSLCCSDGCLI